MAQNPTKVAEDVVVSLAYVLRLDNNEIVDEATRDEPLVYLHGYGNIVPGLEDALEGLTVGSKKKVVVSPEDGYGEYDEDDIDVMPRSEFPPDFEFEEGMELELHDPDTDEYFEAYVADIDEDEITLDFNHPLAGETLFFEVEILALRRATKEELEHGHVDDEDED